MNGSEPGAVTRRARLRYPFHPGLEDTCMNIAVFDTYVLRPDGRRMHFDIVVRDQQAERELDIVLAHGRRYLAAKGIPADTLSARECRFCHSAFASPAVEAEIDRIGFAIVELQNCD